MKATKATLNRALAQPDPAIRFYLFHGQDEAGSRALAERLLKGLGAEKQDVPAARLIADPALLPDEAGALAMFGGPKAIWVDGAKDEIAPAVEALLMAEAVQHPVIALAGKLRNASPLLKLAEASPKALSHISYVPEGRDLARLIVEAGRDVGFRLSDGLAMRIAQAAGGNLAIAERELEKFALFLGADPASPMELDPATVDLLGADSAEADLMRLGDLALAGRMDDLLDELGRLPRGGSEAIPILRALQRRLLMLVPLRARVDRGERVDAVLTSLGKALFWKDKSLVQKLLSNWSGRRLEEALARVSELERQLMLRPLADEAALGETLVTLARAGARPR